ncbi:MAG: hypothetical protein J6O13_16900 [Selenomonas sp.]|nr:hypothetical protein [Selenomonas sp.]
MVLCGILGVVFIRVLPLWGGAFLGIIIGKASIEIMQIDDFVSFWTFLAVTPPLACGLLAAYSERKSGSVLYQMFLSITFIILLLPFSALIVNWIMGTFFNPLDHQWVVVNEVDNPAIIDAQVAKWDAQYKSFTVARHLLNNFFDYGLATLITLVIAFFVIVFVLSKLEKHKTTHEE